MAEFNLGKFSCGTLNLGVLKQGHMFEHICEFTENKSTYRTNVVLIFHFDSLALLHF